MGGPVGVCGAEAVVEVVVEVVGVLVATWLRDDAVVVATPDRFHLPLAAAALRAGKHVLVEKPLAPNVADAQILADLAESSGLVLQVGSITVRAALSRSARVSAR